MRGSPATRERLEERLRLRLRLALLVRGVGVGHDPRAGLQRGLPGAQDERADRDAEVEVAAEVDVAEGAAVEPAGLRLELVDDLHGADLRRARQRPRRERGGERVESVLALVDLAHDRADDVGDVAVVLDLHQLGDLHAAEAADAAEVVAAEVHEHEVLGPLLLVGEQLAGDGVVASRRPAAGACRRSAASRRAGPRRAPASRARRRRPPSRRPSGSTCRATGSPCAARGRR